MATDPTELAIQRLIRIQRISNTLSRDARLRIWEMSERIIEAIIRHDPTSVVARYQTGRINKILEDVQEVSRELIAAARQEMRDSLGAVGVDQVQDSVDSLYAALGVGPDELRIIAPAMNPVFFRKILDTDPFQGRTLREWFGSIQDNTLKGVGQQVRIGMANNETIDQIVQRVRGRSTGKYHVKTLANGQKRRVYRYAGGVMSKRANEVTAVARTAVNYISNRADIEVAEANPDVVWGHEYLATLDSKTTLICANLDGSAWALDDPNRKEPPQHVNCRSTLRKITFAEIEGMGIEKVRQAANYRMVEKDGRQELERIANTRVKADTQYADWLRGQPKEVRANILGKGRAKLFDEGKVSLKDLIRRDGTIIPLSELRNGA